MQRFDELGSEGVGRDRRQTSAHGDADVQAQVSLQFVTGAGEAVNHGRDLFLPPPACRRIGFTICNIAIMLRLEADSEPSHLYQESRSFSGCAC